MGSRSCKAARKVLAEALPVEQMYPELSFLFDPEHWNRCLVSEALAVMMMEDNVASELRSVGADKNSTVNRMLNEKGSEVHVQASLHMGSGASCG